MDKLPVPDEQLMAEDSMRNDVKPPPNVPVMKMAPMDISSAIPEEALVSMPLLEQTGLVSPFYFLLQYSHFILQVIWYCTVV